eukprot:2056303-Rhodomonas_salina.1
MVGIPAKKELGPSTVASPKPSDMGPPPPGNLLRLYHEWVSVHIGQNTFKFSASQEIGRYGLGVPLYRLRRCKTTTNLTNAHIPFDVWYNLSVQTRWHSHSTGAYKDTGRDV